MASKRDAPGARILMISVHGLIRGENMELGRDPDTGGQVKYVVELARALAGRPEVASVDLLTREVPDRRVDPGYAVRYEQLAPNAHIVRLPCGPRRYLRKERLWPFLDSFADQAIQYIRRIGRVPDILHGHYADAGYVGAQGARLLGIPFVFTGHSLGRVKRARLLEQGIPEETLEERYAIGTRIEAEERALDLASLVVASTRQEVEEQYAQYENYRSGRMEVIPPGVDIGFFRPARPGDPPPPVAAELGRFLADPGKPAILAMARPDGRKNFAGLLRAYAGHPELRRRANLVLVAGQRDRIRDMDAESRRVLSDLLHRIDEEDLYGRVAFPKRHEKGDVPDLYRWAAGTGGVFVNPALTEPFGLTLIEAAASGLPVVATNDGGPRDILAACRNGVLVDPRDEDGLARALLEILSDENRWREYSENGLRGARERYTWESHAARYLGEIARLRAGERPGIEGMGRRRSRLPHIHRLVVTDIDNLLTGDPEASRRLAAVLEAEGDGVGLAVATGRPPESALSAMEELSLPAPDILIASVGTEIGYGKDLTPDLSWRRHIDYRWRPEAVREALAECDGLRLQAEDRQRRFKISYDVDAARAPGPAELRRRLRRKGLRVQLVLSHGAFLDVLPIRASPGLALRHLGLRWNLPPDRMLVAGDSGNDADMLSGDTLGVVVGGYSPELEPLRGAPRVYFARAPHARGILEGIEHYDFLGALRVPGEDRDGTEDGR